MDEQTQAIVSLGRALREANYHFITPTPETHRRVRERAAADGADEARDLRDVFGYSRRFHRALLPAPMLELLEASGKLAVHGEMFSSEIRFSNLFDGLYAHSAYPTTGADSVFFGPDTYRYAALLERFLPPCGRIVDVGAGSGAGGLCIGERAQTVTLADINPSALRLAQANAALAGRSCELVRSDVLGAIEGPIDAVISNPPYMRDVAERAYRDGGGSFGEGLSVRIVSEALERLRPGGWLILYTGATIVQGVDTFFQKVQPALAGRAVKVDYRELDPDVFGEELSEPAYADAERIAAVGLIVQR